jgi:hypothetical protein
MDIGKESEQPVEYPEPVAPGKQPVQEPSPVVEPAREPAHAALTLRMPDKDKYKRFTNG